MRAIATAIDRTPAERAFGPAGLSLVEVLVSIVILSVALLAAASLMVGTGQLDRNATMRREMVEVSESKLEQLRAYADARSADTLALAVGGSLTSNTAHHHEKVESAGGREYQLRWLVQSGPAGTRNLTLRVEPRSGNARGTLRRLEAQTYLMIVR